MSATPAPSPPAAQPADAERIIAVVVTYNRRELLLESLTALDAQTRRPDAVFVIDNASTDGTAEAVASAHPQVRLLRLPSNAGGAGGFAAGLAEALPERPDAVWLMDDDTVPEAGALAALLEARRSHARTPALVASRVVWTDGRDHPMNTPRSRPLAGRRRREDAVAVGCLPIRTASFVSVLVDAEAVRRVGLPRADFFLWNDDFEFTARLLHAGDGLWCPGSVVVHKTAKFGGTEADPGERFFLEVRNKVWTLRSPGTLSALERVLYGGSTLRRWARTFAGSPDRRALLRRLVHGLIAGIRTRPRPTDDVLASLGLPRRDLRQPARPEMH